MGRLSVVVQMGTTVGGYVGVTTSTGYVAVGEHGGTIAMTGQSSLAGGLHTLHVRYGKALLTPAWRVVSHHGSEKRSVTGRNL